MENLIPLGFDLNDGGFMLGIEPTATEGKA
jgi:hypothetical protein